MSRKGIPNFEANADERRLVEMVAGVGLTHEQICFLIERPNADGVAVPISVDTLTRHFRDELLKGKAKTTAKMAGKLVSTALGAIGPQQTACLIFWLKTQAGWRETVAIDTGVTDEGSEDAVHVATRIASLLERGRRRARKGSVH